MREIRSYGSVRGVVGDRYPYRDSQNAGAGTLLSLDWLRFANTARSSQTGNWVRCAPG